jgi:hypothetical protein
MTSKGVFSGVLATALVALGGCQPIGEWTGQYVPRQPEVAGSAMGGGAAPVAAMPVASAAELSAQLDGANEVPMTFSGGSGTALASYDDTTGMLSWSVTYDGLTSEATGAHFHGPAAEGENAGVQLNIGETGLASPLQGAAPITPEQAAALLGGLWYVNIHSATFPDGEIRGQLKPAM